MKIPNERELQQIAFEFAKDLNIHHYVVSCKTKLTLQKDNIKDYTKFMNLPKRMTLINLQT